MISYNVIITFSQKIQWPSNATYQNFCNVSLFLENFISHTALNSFDVLLVNSHHSNSNHCINTKKEIICQ